MNWYDESEEEGTTIGGKKLGVWGERKRNLPGKVEGMELGVCWEKRTAVAVEYGAWRYF